MGQSGMRHLGTGTLAIGVSLVTLALTPVDSLAGSLRWQGSQECTSLDECKYAMSHLVSSVLFTAYASENNRLSVAVATSTVSVRDASGAVAATGTECRPIDAQAVGCATPNTRFDIRLGDGDDTAQISSNATAPGPTEDALDVVSADGGPGSDQLSLLTDVPFPHVLIGGSGSDTLTGAAGADVLADAGTGERDGYDGGAGSDTVSYKKRGSSITASLGSESGNEDRLVAIESLIGGSGDDVLRGDGSDNTLQGGPGKDSLFGLAGSDVIDGLTGADRLVGGTGADVIRSGPGADDLQGGPGADTLDPGNDERADRVRCGPGRDRVVSGDDDYFGVLRQYYGVRRRDDRGEILPLPLGPQPTGHESPSSDSGTVEGGEGMDTQDLIGADCEQVELSSHVVLGSPKRAGRKVSVRVISDVDESQSVGCHDGSDRSRRLVLRSGRRVLGSAQLPPGSAKRARWIKVKLNRLGRQSVRRGRTTTVSDFSKNCEGFGYRTRVR